MTSSASEVNSFHENSDVDTGTLAQHHTLGSKPDQAAPGNHKHIDNEWITIGDVGAPAFQGLWANYVGGPPPFEVARFCKVGGIVFMEGLIKNGVMGTTAFILPVGYRPRAQLIFASIEGLNGFGRLDIKATGDVVPSLGNNAFYSVTCSFRASA